MEYVNGVGFAFDWAAIEGRLVTAELAYAGLSLTFMAEVCEADGVLSLIGVHVVAVGSGQLTRTWMVRVAATVMEVLDYDAIIVQGASRTTGASPGHIPKPLRFARRGGA
ncbi:hypothetical protein [Paracoccus sanguinis]|uniref:hypothetical protein n=1 Tax=Paracoccus sanguinis TaxID=1545044 RepID=UPI00145160C6|nr:hypothetical protein [Paracoccus sanguinis]QJD16436.1 hypothetical protein HGN31_05680 [Paracoccus sanguinis]